MRQIHKAAMYKRQCGMALHICVLWLLLSMRMSERQTNSIISFHHGMACIYVQERTAASTNRPLRAQRTWNIVSYMNTIYIYNMCVCVSCIYVWGKGYHQQFFLLWGDSTFFLLFASFLIFLSFFSYISYNFFNKNFCVLFMGSLLFFSALHTLHTHTQLTRGRVHEGSKK